MADCSDDYFALIEDKDKKRADRAIQAMMKMKKLNIAKLKKAHT